MVSHRVCGFGVPNRRMRKVLQEEGYISSRGIAQMQQRGEFPTVIDHKELVALVKFSPKWTVVCLNISGVMAYWYRKKQLKAIAESIIQSQKG